MKQTNGHKDAYHETNYTATFVWQVVKTESSVRQCDYILQLSSRQCPFIKPKSTDISAKAFVVGTH